MLASKGDYIIKGLQGELYPCKPDIFQQSLLFLVKMKRVIKNDKNDERIN